MTHVEYLVHFLPVGLAMLLNEAEQWRNGKHVVLDNTAVVAYEVQNLGLCATGAMNHTMDFRTQFVKQTLDYRSVGTCR